MRVQSGEAGREKIRRGQPPGVAEVSTSLGSGGSALFLTEFIGGLNEGANFLSRLSAGEIRAVCDEGRQRCIPAGGAVFRQGSSHNGIFIIQRGQVRVFYSAPSGREITLAYWPPGHFVGGPEISGRGVHMWSGEATEDCEVTILPPASIETLIRRVPNFALCLVQGLVAKGKCYSTMAQILGTRSVIQRLAQFLVNLSELEGVDEAGAIIIKRRITHDQIAAMVGATRQWVTMMLLRFRREGILAPEGRYLRIDRPDRLIEISCNGTE